MAAYRIVSIVTAAGQKIAVEERRHPMRSYGLMFSVTFDEKLAALVSQITSATTLRLLIELRGYLDYVQFRRVDQVRFAARLNSDQATISRALRHLHRLGFLDRHRTGPLTEWRLSPEFGWRGTVESYHAERRARALLGTPADSGAMPTVVAEDIFQKHDDPAPLAPQRRIRLLAPVRSP